MKKIALLILISIGLASCEPHAYYDLLPGKWNATDWTRVGSDANLTEGHSVSFEFTSDKTYTSDIAGNVEQGKYRCSHDLIIFTPEGKTDLPVQVLILDKAQLQIKMDNNGLEEIMTLKKQ